MEHLSSDGMFLRDEMKTPDYKAFSAHSSLVSAIELIKGLSENDPERAEAVNRLLEFRQVLVDNIDLVSDEDKKVEYHRLIVDADEFLPEVEKSQEL